MPDSRIEAIRCKCCSSLLLLCLVDSMHCIPQVCGTLQQHWFRDQSKLVKCCVDVAPAAPCKVALLCCAASMHCNLLLFSVTKQEDFFYHSKLLKCCVHVAPLLLLARLLCRAASLHCVLLFSVPSSMCFFSKPMCSDMCACSTNIGLYFAAALCKHSDALHSALLFDVPQQVITLANVGGFCMHAAPYNTYR